MRRWSVLFVVAAMLAAAGGGLWYWQQPDGVEKRIGALPGVTSVEVDGTTSVAFDRSTSADQLSAGLHRMAELRESEDVDALEIVDVAVGPVEFSIDEEQPATDETTALAAGLAAVPSVHAARIAGSVNVWTTADAEVVPAAQRILASIARHGLDEFDHELAVIGHGDASDSSDGRSLEIEKTAMRDVANVRLRVDLLGRGLSESGATFERGRVTDEVVSVAARVTSQQDLAAAYGAITRTVSGQPVSLTLESDDLRLVGSPGPARAGVPLAAVLSLVDQVEDDGIDVTSVATDLEFIQLSVRNDASLLGPAIDRLRDSRLPEDARVELTMGEHAGLRGMLDQVSASVPLVLGLRRAGLEGQVIANGPDGAPELHVYAKREVLRRSPAKAELMEAMRAVPAAAKVELIVDGKEVLVGSRQQATTMAPVILQLLQAEFLGSFDATDARFGPVLSIGSDSELKDLRDAYVQSELVRILRRGAWPGTLRLEIAGLRRTEQGNSSWPPLRFTSTADGEATAVYPTGSAELTPPGTLPGGPDGQFVQTWNASAS